MDGSKTGIWRGGFAGLLRSEHRSEWANEPVDAAPADVTGLAAVPLALEHLPKSPVIVRDPAAPVSRVATLRGLPNAPAHGELQSTRIMPIERLLPESARTRNQSAAPTIALGTGAEPRPRAKRQVSSRWWQYPLVALVTLVTVGAIMVPPLLKKTAPVLAPAASTPAVQIVEAPAPAVERAATADNALPSQRRRAPSLQPTAAANNVERQAVDALIAGDYAGAQRLYEQLAQGKPHARVFAVAARVAAARASAQ